MPKSSKLATATGQEVPVSGIARLIHRGKTFLEDDLWSIETDSRPKYQALAIRQLRLAILAVEDFQRSNIGLQAYSLTFASLLTIVPLFAIIALAMKTFGQVEELQVWVQTELLENVLPSTEQQISSTITQMVDSISFGSLGLIGGMVTIITVLMSMKQLEDSFNEIMRSKPNKDLFARFTRYWFIITLGPSLLGGSLRLQTMVMNIGGVETVLSHGLVSWFVGTFAPVVIVTVLFTLLYLLLPSTRVSPLAALYAGGLVAVVFEIAKRTYYVSIAGSARINAVYGTLAALPVTMIWFYFIWTLVLFGAVWAYTCTNLRSLSRAKTLNPLSFEAQEALALGLLVTLYRSQDQGHLPPTEEQMAATFNLHPRHVSEMLGMLHDGNFVAELAREDNDQSRYVPVVAANKLSPQAVVTFLRKNGEPLPERGAKPDTDILDEPTVTDLAQVAGMPSFEAFLQGSERTNP